MQQLNQVELDLIEQFTNRLPALPGGSDVQDFRKLALASFRENGLPHRRLESWHYTDLRSKLKSALPIADLNGSGTDSGEFSIGIDSHKIVAINGQFAAMGSDSLPKDGAVTVAQLAEFLQDEGNFQQFSALVEESSATIDSESKDALIDLNSAFMESGTVIEVADGAKADKPLELIHVTGGEPVSNFARHLIRIGKDAAVTIIENHTSMGTAANQTNCVIDVVLGENSKLNWVKVQRENDSATHLGTLSAKIATGAEFDHFTFNSGGNLARTQLFVKFDGEGAKANLKGVSLLDSEDHSDITLNVDHAVPNCESSEDYKKVIDGRGHGVFQGKIVVRPDAQKTNGKMMVQSLLLSDEAAMSSKPELEIFADDVVCGHGSTTGQIDEELLFYLQSRGLPEREAKSMLILAFISEVIEQIEDETIVAVLEQQAQTWLKS